MEITWLCHIYGGDIEQAGDDFVHLCTGSLSWREEMCVSYSASLLVEVLHRNVQSHKISEISAKTSD